MGTDIHSIAQVQVDGKWRTVAVGIGGDPRSYNMFAMLADVRNGYGFAGIKTSDPFPVIHERRGLPSDLALNEDGDSLTIKSDNRMWMGDHSHSWCLLSELEFFVEQVASKHQSILYGIIDRAVSAEWKESALECSRLGSIMEALREVAAVCNVPHDSVRYVYGFDS